MESIDWLLVGFKWWALCCVEYNICQSHPGTCVSDQDSTEGRSYCKTVGWRPRIFGVKGRIVDGDDEELEPADSMPKRRTTSLMVTTIDTAIRMMMIHVWPIGAG